MNKVLEYIIRAKDATGNAVSSALSKVKGLAAGIGRNLMNIKAGFDMMASAAKAALGKLQKAFQFETMTVQFKMLMGSMDEAKAHMAMLQKMGDTPPFSLEQFAAASRSLMVMSDGALGFEDSLKLVGDAAAATGQPIESLAHEIGRAYAIIRDGQPLTRATMGLRNMGAITPEVAEKLDDLQKAGASNAEIWGVLTGELKKFKGSMEETATTGEGLMGAIQSQWDDAVRTFGGALLETSKSGLSLLLEKLKELNEDGTINVWADKCGRALEKVMEYTKTAIGWVGKLKKVWDWWQDANEVLGSAVGGAIGTLMGGGTLKDAAHSFRENAFQSYQEVFIDRKAEEAKREEEIRTEAVRKRKEEEKKLEEQNAKHEAKVKEQLAKAQVKITAKREEEARKKLEKKLAKERQKELNTELRGYRKQESEASSRYSEAQSKKRDAWGWFKDDKAWDDQRKEEKQDAKAERRFQNRFAKLQAAHPDDWRTATGLSKQMEVTRRVALAREEEANAKAEMERAAAAAEQCEQHLAKLAENIDSGGE